MRDFSDKKGVNNGALQLMWKVFRMRPKIINKVNLALHKPNMSINIPNEDQPQGQFRAGGDPNITSTSYLTENRRRYPRDRNGGKNEWRAIIQHQADVNNQINQFEKELKHLRAQQLGQAYNQKLQEQIQMKEAQLKQRQYDAEIMNARVQQYQEVYHQDLLD